MTASIPEPRPVALAAALLLVLGLSASIPAVACPVWRPTHAEMEAKKARLVTRVEGAPDDIGAWTSLLEFLAERPQDELYDALRATRRDWVLDPRLLDPVGEVARYEADLEIWRARFREAFGDETAVSCLTRQALGESLPSAAEILGLPTPDLEEELNCRLDLLDAPDDLELAARYRDVDPSDADRHAPLLDLLEYHVDDSPTLGDAWIEALFLHLREIPDDPDAGLEILRAYAELERDFERGRWYDTLRAEAETSEERVTLCRIGRDDDPGHQAVCFRDLIRGLPPDDDMLEVSVNLLRDLVDHLPGGFGAWLELAPPRVMASSWRDLPLDDAEACERFRRYVEEGNFDGLPAPAPEAASTMPSALRIGRWLDGCRLPEAAAAWRRHATERWGAGALADPRDRVPSPVTPAPPAEPQPMAPLIAAGLLQDGETDGVAEAAWHLLRRPDASPREQAEAEYLLGRVALLEGRSDEARRRLESYFVRFTRFRGIDTLRWMDGPYRHWLAEQGGDALPKYHQKILRAAAEYRRFFGDTADPARLCGAAECLDGVRTEFLDVPVLVTGRSNLP